MHSLSSTWLDKLDSRSLVFAATVANHEDFIIRTHADLDST
jgi:hypothetical protein